MLDFIKWLTVSLAALLLLVVIVAHANDDRVYVNCGTLIGKGDVVIWLGSDKYVIPVECKNART